MATHRKKSAKKRIRTGELAVAAFLGLAVTAAPAVAVADTPDSSSNGPSAPSDSDSKPADNGDSGPKAGPKAGGETALSNDDDDDDKDVIDDDIDIEKATAAVDAEDSLGSGNEDAELDEAGDGETEVIETPSEPEAIEPEPVVTEPVVTEPVVTEPAVTEPIVTEPVVTDTELETPEAPAGPDAAPVVDELEVPVPEPAYASLSLADTDASPTPPALASALLEIDIVPEPPSIPAFAPLQGIIDTLVTWIDRLLPPFEPSPILNPTQVAAGWVMTLFAGLQSSYWNGSPTPITFAAYVLMSVAYQRYERLATNQLPGQPTVASGVLPLTWKLTSVDPDGDPLIYSVGLNNQPTNGLITMLPDGTFSFVPASPADLISGTDVTFTVNINDSLGFLEHPLTPNGNDAAYEVTFHYPGLGIGGGNIPPIGGLPSNTIAGNNGVVRGHVVGVINADNDPLTYSIKGANGATTVYTEGGGIVHIEADGSFVYVPKVNKDAIFGADIPYSDSFTIVVSDGRDGTADVPVLLGVLSLTSSLTDVNVSKTSTGNGTVTGAVTLHSENNGLFSYGVGTDPTKGTVTVNADGTYTYTATSAGYNESDTFTIVGTIDGLSITVATVSVVPKSNAAPSVDPIDLVTIIGGTGIATGNVSAHDANGDTLHYSVTGFGGGSTKTLSNGAIVTVDSTGKWSYIPGLDSGDLGGLSPVITLSSFTVYVTDGKGGQDSTSVVVTTHELDIPVTKVGSSGTVTGGLQLPAGQQGLMTYSVDTGPTKGTVTVNADGTYTYTATTAGYNETDTFTIKGTVGGQTITVAEVSVVPKSNAAPSVDPIELVTIIGGTGIATGNVSAHDANGDTLHYSVTGFGGGSTKVLSNGAIVTVDSTGKWSYVPGLDSGDPLFGAIVASSFTVYVSDGKGGEASTGVLVTTHNLDVPVTKVGNGVGSVTGGLTLPAGQQGVLTYSVGTGPSKGTVTVNADGTYTYTRTAPGHAGGPADSFDIMGSVGGFTIKIATVSVSPTLDNVAPTGGTTTITDSSLTNVIGTYYQSTSGKVTAFDADGDPVDYPGGSIIPATYTSANGGLVQFFSDGSFNYTIGPKLSGYFHAASASGATGTAVNDTFTITVTDSLGASSTIVVSIPIEKLNHGPDATASVGGKTTDALGVVRGTVSGSDDDDDSLTYSLVGGTNGTAATANGGIVRFSGNSFTYIPTAGKATDSFQVLVNDGHGGTSTATVSLTGLTTPSPTTGVSIATPNVVTGQLNTAGNTGLTYSVGGQGAKGTVSVTATGAFTYTRNGALGHTQTPGDTFTIKATDANGNSVTIATVNVTPTVANNAPVGTGVTTDAPVGSPTYNPLGGPSDKQTTTGTLNATDADGDQLTFAAGTYSTTNGGSVTVTAGGSFTYTLTKFAPFGIHDSYWHDSAATGTPGDTFTVNVTDGFGAPVAVTYSVPIATLNKVPDASVSVGGKTTDALGVVRGTVTGSDDDDDSLSYTLVGATNGSAATVNGGIVRFSGNSFTYIPTAGKTTDSFQVLVNDGHGGTSTATVSLTGLSTPSPATVTNNVGTSTITLNVPANDAALLTFSAGSAGQKGTSLVRNADGTFTYTRNPDLGHSTDRNDTITIIATDTSGKTVTIATVNVAPVIANADPTPGPTSITSSTLTADTIIGIPNGKFTQTTKGTLSGTDADGDAVSFTPETVTTADGGSVTITATGAFTYTMGDKAASYFHAAAQIGATGAALTDTFSAKAVDAFGGITTYTVTVATLPRNSAATGNLSGTSGRLIFSQSVTVTLNSTDDDGDALTITGVSPTTSGSTTFNVATGKVTYTSYTVPVGWQFKYAPAETFTVYFIDGYGGSGSTSFTF